MSDPHPRSFFADFRLFFLRGLVVLLPTVLTLWIVVKAYQFIDNAIAEPINEGIRIVMHRATPAWEPLQRRFEPTDEAIALEISRQRALGRPRPNPAAVAAALRGENIREWWDSRWYLDLIGLVVAIVAVYFAGRLLGGFFGRRIYRRLEQAITTLPVFKQVYPYVKQIVDFLFGEDRKVEFKRVVLVEYPRKGIWSLGFATGRAMGAVSDRVGEESMTIFIPSSPTPFTGYTISVPKREVIELPITVDEALRFTVSGGVLMPGDELPEGVTAEAIRQPTTPPRDPGEAPVVRAPAPGPLPAPRGADADDDVVKKRTLE